MASNNSFLDVLGTIDGKIQRMSTEVKTIRHLATTGQMEDAYAVSLRLAKISERSTLLTRLSCIVEMLAMVKRIGQNRSVVFNINDKFIDDSIIGNAYIRS